MNIRLATNDDGGRIQELLTEGGFTVEGLDWSDIEPYWLVAEEEQIIGCIQIILAKPVGWLEFLGLEPSLGKKRKARAMKALVSHGAALLKGFGAQLAMGTVPEDLESYLTVLRHRGAVVTSRAVIVAKRL